MLVGTPIQSPRTMCRSEWQTPAELIRISASSYLGVGDGRSWIRTSPSTSRAAFTRSPPVLADLPPTQAHAARVFIHRTPAQYRRGDGGVGDGRRNVRGVP